MHEHDTGDRSLRERFRAARLRDEASAPGYEELLAAARRRGAAPQPRWALWAPLAAAVATIGIAAAFVASLPDGPPVMTAEAGAPAVTEPPSSAAPPSPEPDAAPEPAPVAATKRAERAAAIPGPVPAAPGVGTGGLVVIVADGKGNPLPGATVTLAIPTDPSRPYSTLTNARGEAVFPPLRPGEGYAVSASRPGFETWRVTDLRIEAGQIENLPIVLSESRQETVRILTAQVLVDRDQSASLVSFDDESARDLAAPGRFYQSMLTPATGAQDSDAGADPAVQGSRGRDFRAEVAGVGNVDPLTGRFTSVVGAGSIEETAVVSGGAGVEFRRAQGGFERIVQKQVTGSVGGVPVSWIPPDAIEELPPQGPSGFDTELYDPIDERKFVAVADEPLSTFSIDVDTGAYANVRRFLRSGRLPPASAVRIEELLNYFSYDDPPPTDGSPFATHVEVAGCPWNPEHRVARIGLTGRDVARGELGGSSLVFLIDVSGSMRPPDKLPLLKSALALLVDELDGRDRVAIVVYAGRSGLVLPSTPGSDKAAIRDAIEQLSPSGSTNGGAGIRLAYRIAREQFIEGGINRVILATDGDFNVGITDRGELLNAIEEDARRGIALTTLGFGTGNYKDAMLEQLADRGNGNHFYIDSLREARKVLVEELVGALVTIAKDVKIQVEFNPARVGAWRLIGYENRALANEDFNDDRKDAGEIGAGHHVTALYELIPPGNDEAQPAVDPLRYRQSGALSEAAASGEVLTLKLRYKLPTEESSRLLTFPAEDAGLDATAASDDFRFAAAVASFGMLLRDSEHRGEATWERTEALALGALGADESGYRAEFVDLVREAARLAAASAER